MMATNVMSVQDATSLLAADVGRYAAAQVLVAEGVSSEKERCAEILRVACLRAYRDEMVAVATALKACKDLILATPPELTEPEVSTGEPHERTQ